MLETILVSMRDMRGVVIVFKKSSHLLRLLDPVYTRLISIGSAILSILGWIGLMRLMIGLIIVILPFSIIHLLRYSRPLYRLWIYLLLLTRTLRVKSVSLLLESDVIVRIFNILRAVVAWLFARWSNCSWDLNVQKCSLILFLLFIILIFRSLVLNKGSFMEAAIIVLEWDFVRLPAIFFIYQLCIPSWLLILIVWLFFDHSILLDRHCVIVFISILTLMLRYWSPRVSVWLYSTIILSIIRVDLDVRE